MRINAFKCEECENMYNVEQRMLMQMPEGWITLHQSANKEDLHFCSIGCLGQWVDVQRTKLTSHWEKLQGHGIGKTTINMAKGIIRIRPIAIKEDIDLTVDPSLIDIDKLKEVLLLPERYAIEQVKHDSFRGMWENFVVDIVVSSPDIPEPSEGETLPTVDPWYYSSDDYENKTRIVSLMDIKVNNVSVIKEDDKKLTRTIKIIDLVNNSVSEV